MMQLPLLIETELAVFTLGFEARDVVDDFPGVLQRGSLSWGI